MDRRGVNGGVSTVTIDFLSALLIGVLISAEELKECSFNITFDFSLLRRLRVTEDGRLKGDLLVSVLLSVVSFFSIL